MRGPAKRPEDFTKFYYTKVAMGEGCGCAERIIDTHELDRRAAGVPVGRTPRGASPLGWVKRLIGRKK